MPVFLGSAFLQFSPCLAHRALTAWPYGPLCGLLRRRWANSAFPLCRQTQPELPAEPQSSGEESSSEDDSDLFVNTNRRQYHESEEESEEEEAA